MKKSIYLLIVLMTVAYYGNAQSGSPKIRLNAYGSYVFDDKVDSYYSSTDYFNGTIKGGFLWGGGLEFMVHQAYGIELLYQRLDTKAPVEYYDYNTNRVKNADIDLAVNYIMVGGSRYIHPNAKVEPYAGFLLGMAIADAKNPETNNSHSATKFAWGLHGGANFWASEKVGIKLQAQLLSVPQGAGGALYFGTGGAGAGVSTYSTVLQFALGGGLTFKLGGSHGAKAELKNPGL